MGETLCRKMRLRFNPTAQLISEDDEALAYFARRDLLDEIVPPVESLWELPEAQQLIGSQQSNGCWKYPGRSLKAETWENYALLETYRNLRMLVEMYGMNRKHPAVTHAADYLYSCQSSAGDIRGILGNQTMPYYHGAMLELLIKAGYAQDERTIAGLEWLLNTRQDDGGWLVPTQTIPTKLRTDAYWSGEAVRADPGLPHSHLATGMALRAFAAHPDYREHPESALAGERLKERLFKPDSYNDRKTPQYWLKFQFPFWWTSLLTALDTLARLGYRSSDPDIARGINWFIENQEGDGLWPTGYSKGSNAERNRRWVGLAVCRALNILAGSDHPQY